VEESEEEFELEAMSSKALPKQKQKKQAKTVVRSCQWNILGGFLAIHFKEAHKLFSTQPEVTGESRGNGRVGGGGRK
jgi:hypothetical protein